MILRSALHSANSDCKRPAARLRVGWVDGWNLIPPSPLSAGYHPACGLALPALYAQLSRRGGPSRRAWARHLLRNRPQLGAEVRTGVVVNTMHEYPPQSHPEIRPTTFATDLYGAFSVKRLFWVCCQFFVRSGKGRSSSRRLRSGSRSARKGSRDRTASGAWRLAA